MKKILAITNSFGVDANHYLYGVSRVAGDDIKIVSLYIGGCSLYRHYRNMLSEEKAYILYVNGMNSGFYVSLKEALLSDEWDIVTFQQASPKSFDISTYSPYIQELSAYVKKMAPNAKQYIHGTWGYSGEKLVKSGVPYTETLSMFADIRKAYDEARKLIFADGLIPCTAAMEKLYVAIGNNTHRDGYHASLGVGRYMLALVWYMVIFGKKVDGNTFNDFDVTVTDEEVALAKKLATEAVLEEGYLLRQE